MKFSLQQCAEIYNTLVNNTYQLTLNNESCLCVRFGKENFKHLLGLHKLEDIPPIYNGKMSSTAIFNDLLKGKTLEKQILRSKNLSQIQARIDYFYFLPTLLHGRFIVNFDIRMVKGESQLRATEYILYKKVSSGWIHLTIGGHVGGYYPETFFFNPTQKYISEQKLSDITSTQISFSDRSIEELLTI